MVEIESVLSFNFYTYGKPFTGSDHGKRFRIVKEERELPGEPKEELPDGEEAEVKKENVLAVCIWPEPFAYDKTGEEKKKRQILRLGIITALCIALLINLAAWTQTDLLISIFNSSRSAMLSRIAHPGLRIYFTGFLCSGLNIFLASSFSADDKAAASACVSLSRGFAAICAFALVLSRLFGMTGIWASYPAAEAFTLMLALGWLISGSRKK